MSCLPRHPCKSHLYAQLDAYNACVQSLPSSTQQMPQVSGACSVSRSHRAEGAHANAMQMAQAIRNPIIRPTERQDRTSTGVLRRHS